MTIAPCRALARFRHREKIAHKRQMRGGRIYDRWRRRCRMIAVLGQSGEPRMPQVLRERPPIPPMRQLPPADGMGEVVTRMREQVVGGLPHLCVELRRADALSDAERQWAKAVVAVHTHMMQALAATGSASVFIPSKPDARRGPENYWWDHATGASGRERK